MDFPDSGNVAEGFSASGLLAQRAVVLFIKEYDVT